MFPAADSAWHPTFPGGSPLRKRMLREDGETSPGRRTAGAGLRTAAHRRRAFRVLRKSPIGGCSRFFVRTVCGRSRSGGCRPGREGSQPENCGGARIPAADPESGGSCGRQPAEKGCLSPWTLRRTGMRISLRAEVLPLRRTRGPLTRGSPIRSDCGNRSGRDEDAASRRIR